MPITLTDLLRSFLFLLAAIFQETNILSIFDMIVIYYDTNAIEIINNHLTVILYLVVVILTKIKLIFNSKLHYIKLPCMQCNHHTFSKITCMQCSSARDLW